MTRSARPSLPALCLLTGALALGACASRRDQPPEVADAPASLATRAVVVEVIDPQELAHHGLDATGAPLPVELDAIGAPPAADQGQNASRTAEAARMIGGATSVPLPAASSGVMAAASPAASGRVVAYQPVAQDRERYAHFDDDPVHLVSEDPVSTFSIDVDTGSYANVRRFLEHGALPPSDAVRTEELINYFSYDYPAPEGRELPFAVHTEVAPAPWDHERLLLKIGIRGYAVPLAERPPANLVFLVDVSGSMQSPDKLALLKPAFAMLARTLRPQDKISLVVYAGASGVVLPPTPAAERGIIEAAIAQLEAGGSTNGSDGIRLAYAMARQGFVAGGINRVVLATDGDFNVGMVDTQALIDLVERERASGITLTTLGVGTGNFNDELMERLADAGNGNYAYLDSLMEARKVLVDQVGSTLQVIAGDVKAQVEFNPQLVAEYRLVGYGNRVLRREDFNNDQVDAGDIGAGHTVTALYELTLVTSSARQVDPLRYAKGSADPRRGPQPVVQAKDELAFVKLRYKLPGEGSSRLISQPIRASAVAAASQELRFAAAVAAFGQALRGGEHLAGFGLGDIEQLARGARGADPRGERAEFLRLVGLAQALAPADPRQAAR